MQEGEDEFIQQLASCFISCSLMGEWQDEAILEKNSHGIISYSLPKGTWATFKSAGRGFMI